MKPAPFDYYAPTTVDEACGLLAESGGGATIIAGGQTLMPLLALRMSQPFVLVDINRITALKGVPHIVWDGSGDNPYFGFLALADAIVVTEDSVNMVTEAAGTGKPVYVQGLPGRSNRLARFHRLMRERGATRPFQGRLESWSYAPINDTEMVAAAVRQALGLESKG